MKERSRTFELSVWGDRGLFTDPMSKVGGERVSYEVPTYEALRGILSSVYWNPAIEWIVDSVRVMNPIVTETHGTRTVTWLNERGMRTVTALFHPRYQIRAHFEWKDASHTPEGERIWRRHEAMALRALSKGGRHDVFLGSRDMKAFVEKERFGSGTGYYDDSGEIDMGLMYHGLDYPDGIRKGKPGRRIVMRMAPVVMKDGIIDFPRPDECTLRKPLTEMKERKFRDRRRYAAAEGSL